MPTRAYARQGTQSRVEYHLGLTFNHKLEEEKIILEASFLANVTSEIPYLYHCNFIHSSIMAYHKSDDKAQRKADRRARRERRAERAQRKAERAQRKAARKLAGKPAGNESQGTTIPSESHAPPSGTLANMARANRNAQALPNHPKTRYNGKALLRDYYPTPTTTAHDPRLLTLHEVQIWAHEIMDKKVEFSTTGFGCWICKYTPALKTRGYCGVSMTTPRS